MKKNEIIEKFVCFQQTGTGFDVVWAAMQPVVEEFARRVLRKYGVKVWTGHGASAVDDVSSQTKLRLLELGQPGARGRFDPSRTKSAGLSGLQGWLWRVVERQAIDCTRATYRCGDRKLFLESDLEWNDQCTDGDRESILKQTPAKVERAALLPILEECINQLAEPLMRDAVLLKLHEGLSEAATAARLGVSDTTIHRRLQAAYAILRPLLESHGIDDRWLAA